jgi:rod shape determining protein RodA
MPWYRSLDVPTVMVWLALVAVGLVAIYSSTHGPAAQHLHASTQQSFVRQAAWLGICLGGLVVALLLPVRVLRLGAYPIYGLTTLLLVAALVVGKEVNGAKSWLALGPLRLQVSELAKVGTVLAVAQRLSARQGRTGHTLRYALQAVGLIVLPGVLIVLQNDMGTALIFFGLIPVILFWGGLPLQTVVLLVAPAVAGYLALVYMPAALGFAALFTGAMYLVTRQRMVAAAAAALTGGVAALVSLVLTRLLQPYQVARLLSFTNPEAEEFRQGVGFHLVQSKAAIGSGGLWGKGFMEGTQTQGAYVPEQSTDFIFSVIGEEFGFVGAMLVLALYAVLLLRLIALGTEMKHPFGHLLATAVVGIYLLHIFVNIGMATGILPVIGIPLPFLSYGGSALLANSAMLALVLSTHLHRDDLSIYGY